jgi:hypothetical protein
LGRKKVSSSRVVAAAVRVGKNSAADAKTKEQPKEEPTKPVKRIVVVLVVVVVVRFASH